jgi:hypothetical protein
MDIRKPIFTADGRIDCEIHHPEFGWIPFTADTNDVEILGQQVYEQALAMEPAPYVAPPIVPPSKEEQGFYRQSAYTSEADPLFFKWQAGEATEEEWLAKRQEIRDRYPYPSE